MTLIDNGGANAIKGFNYQKSVIILIAVLHYLKVNEFELYVETSDDIVVKIKDTKTYIQVKGKKLSITTLTARPKSKGVLQKSIIEKNLENDDEKESRYKVVGLEFAASEKYLSKVSPNIFKKGAEVYKYTLEGKKQLLTKIPELNENKLDRSRIVLTDFGADLEKALEHILGIMNTENIMVDNNYGQVALEELCLEIDQKSEIKIGNYADLEKKRFTSESLSKIFRYSYKEDCINEILKRLDYTVLKEREIKIRRGRIRSVYSSVYYEAVQEVEAIDNLEEMQEKAVMKHILMNVDFRTVVDDLDKEAIALEAFSGVVFERSKV